SRRRSRTPSSCSSSPATAVAVRRAPGRDSGGRPGPARRTGSRWRWAAAAVWGCRGVGAGGGPGGGVGRAGAGRRGGRCGARGGGRGGAGGGNGVQNPKAVREAVKKLLGK